LKEIFEKHGAKMERLRKAEFEKRLDEAAKW
jgi:hypothetical protein